MAHPYHKHGEHAKSHSRVHHILKGGGHKRGGAAHADAAADRKLFRSMIADQADQGVPGAKRGGRFARGGRTKANKGGQHTNIAVVVPHGRPAAGSQAGGPPSLPPPPPQGGGPPALPPPGLGGPGGPPLPPGGPPGLKPPGMMKRGGKVKRQDGGSVGDASAGNLKKWADRASANSYARGGRLPDAGALSGEGRLEKAALHKRRK